MADASAANSGRPAYVPVSSRNLRNSGSRSRRRYSIPESRCKRESSNHDLAAALCCRLHRRADCGRSGVARLLQEVRTPASGQSSPAPARRERGPPQHLSRDAEGARCRRQLAIPAADTALPAILHAVRDQVRRKAFCAFRDRRCGAGLVGGPVSCAGQSCPDPYLPGGLPSHPGRRCLAGTGQPDSQVYPEASRGARRR
ncbi:hypothetical protein D9M70_526870 [compost metagenome]